MADLKRMDRREAIKWMLAASATLAMTDARKLDAALPGAGYGTDPNLMEVYRPGQLWPLSFTEQQHRTVSALCDVILPADDKSPSASQLKVPDFIDEWISAPYPRQQADRELLLQGLEWFEAESDKLFHQRFAELSEEQKRQICDQVCSVQSAASGRERAALFFDKFRDLTLGGFYTTPEGVKDIQYVGNVPLTKFDGPPAEVLSYLKLT